MRDIFVWILFCVIIGGNRIAVCMRTVIPHMYQTRRQFRVIPQRWGMHVGLGVCRYVFDSDLQVCLVGIGTTVFLSIGIWYWGHQVSPTLAKV